jgi:hypothetical protein
MEERTPSRFLSELGESVARRRADAPLPPAEQEAREQAAAAHFFSTMRAKLGIDGPAAS